MKIPKPRAHYAFHKMGPFDLIRVRIPDDDPKAGARALCAAYAYGRRNGLKFCGGLYVVPKSGNRYMVIRRVV